MVSTGEDPEMLLASQKLLRTNVSVATNCAGHYRNDPRSRAEC